MFREKRRTVFVRSLFLFINRQCAIDRFGEHFCRRRFPCEQSDKDIDTFFIAEVRRN
jgi:hypothetical protein